MDERARQAVIGETEAQLEVVDLDRLDKRYGALRLRRPGLVAALRRSIERDGLLEPLLVNLEPGGRLSLIDGFKRLQALVELGETRALGCVVRLDAAGVRVALVTRNASHRGLCVLEQAWVVRDLVRGCKLSQPRVGALLGRHKSWVCRRLMMIERLDETLQEDMRLGLVSATLAQELARLPRGNQSRVAMALRGHGFSARRAAPIINRALRCRNEAELSALLRNPYRSMVDGEELRRAIEAYIHATRELNGLLGAGQTRHQAPKSEWASELERARRHGRALLSKLEEKR